MDVCPNPFGRQSSSVLKPDPVVLPIAIICEESFRAYVWDLEFADPMSVVHIAEESHFTIQLGPTTGITPDFTSWMGAFHALIDVDDNDVEDTYRIEYDGLDLEWKTVGGIPVGAFDVSGPVSHV